MGGREGGHELCLFSLGGCQRAGEQGLCVAIGHRGGISDGCHKRTDFYSLGGIYNN